MILRITKKTGFKNLDPFTPVIITDMRELPFYSTENILPNYEFNLPIGTYKLKQGKIIPQSNPVRFKLPILPPPERNKPAPVDFKLVINSNPHKAYIDWVNKVIAFNRDLLNKPLPHIYFILFHEYGHHLYKSEHLADLFAVRKMLLRGFNPSQIGTSPIVTLSKKNFFRKGFITDSLTI